MALSCQVRGMTFIRTKRVRKNGRTYVYQYAQASVRVGRKVRSIHLGKAGEGHVPAMLEDEHMFGKEKASAKEASKQLNAVAPDGVHEASQDSEARGSDVGQK